MFSMRSESVLGVVKLARFCISKSEKGVFSSHVRDIFHF